MQNAKVQGNTKLCIFAFNFAIHQHLTPITHHLTPTTQHRVSIFLVHNELNLFAFAHREYHLRSSFSTTD